MEIGMLEYKSANLSRNFLLLFHSRVVLYRINGYKQNIDYCFVLCNVVYDTILFSTICIIMVVKVVVSR